MGASVGKRSCRFMSKVSRFLSIYDRLLDGRVLIKQELVELAEKNGFDLRNYLSLD